LAEGGVVAGERLVIGDRTARYGEGGAGAIQDAPSDGLSLILPSDGSCSEAAAHRAIAANLATRQCHACSKSLVVDSAPIPNDPPAASRQVIDHGAVGDGCGRGLAQSRIVTIQPGVVFNGAGHAVIEDPGRSCSSIGCVVVEHTVGDR